MFGIGEIRDGKIVRFIPVGDCHDDDEYGFRATFREQTIAKLVDIFNGQRKSAGWVRARAYWLGSLCAEFQARSVDCSSFIQDGEMDLSCEIRLEGDKITQV